MPTKVLSPYDTYRKIGITRTIKRHRRLSFSELQNQAGGLPSNLAEEAASLPAAALS